MGRRLGLFFGLLDEGVEDLFAGPHGGDLFGELGAVGADVVEFLELFGEIGFLAGFLEVLFPSSPQGPQFRHHLRVFAGAQSGVESGR